MKNVVFIIITALLLCSCVSQSKHDREIEELEYTISRLESENDYLEEKVDRLQGIIKRARKEVNDADDYLIMNEYFLASLSVYDALLILDGRK